MERARKEGFFSSLLLLYFKPRIRVKYTLSPNLMPKSYSIRDNVIRRVNFNGPSITRDIKTATLKKTHLVYKWQSRKGIKVSLLKAVTVTYFYKKIVITQRQPPDARFPLSTGFVDAFVVQEVYSYVVTQRCYRI